MFLYGRKIEAFNSNLEILLWVCAFMISVKKPLTTCSLSSCNDCVYTKVKGKKRINRISGYEERKQLPTYGIRRLADIENELKLDV